MNERKDILLGHKVRDKISLLEGVVDCIIHQLNCVDRISVQPQGDGKKCLEAWHIDVTGVEVVDNGKRVIEVDEPVAKYKLGTKAKCAITDFEGTIVSIRKMINGCVGYLLIEKHVVGKKPNRFESLEPNLTVEEKPEVKVKHNKTLAGCSSQKSSEYF